MWRFWPCLVGIRDHFSFGLWRNSGNGKNAREWGPALTVRHHHLDHRGSPLQRPIGGAAPHPGMPRAFAYSGNATIRGQASYTPKKEIIPVFDTTAPRKVRDMPERPRDPYRMPAERDFDMRHAAEGRPPHEVLLSDCKDGRQEGLPGCGRRDPGRHKAGECEGID